MANGNDQFKIILPKAVVRPDCQLSATNIKCLELYLLLKDTAFENIYEWLHTNDKGTPVQKKAKARELFNTWDAKQYLEDRSKQINDFLSGNIQEKEELDGGESMDDVLARFKKKIITYMSKSNLEDYGDDEVIKLAVKEVMKTLNMDAEGTPPLRVLAEQCTSCRYRIFCEENTTDVCLSCRYKKYANENNIFYDHKTQLEK